MEKEVEAPTTIGHLVEMKEILTRALQIIEKELIKQDIEINKFWDAELKKAKEPKVEV